MGGVSRLKALKYGTGESEGTADPGAAHNPHSHLTRREQVRHTACPHSCLSTQEQGRMMCTF